MSKRRMNAGGMMNSTSWTPESGDKPEITYSEFLHEDWRVRMLKMWSDIQREHALEGCPLDPAPDGSVAGACELHGYNKNNPPMTKDEWMHSYE